MNAKTQQYQRPVNFIYFGVRGHCDRSNWVRYGNMGCHLDELAIDSGVRQMIHKLRNREPYAQR